jgi:hypothetical protein
MTPKINVPAHAIQMLHDRTDRSDGTAARESRAITRAIVLIHADHVAGQLAKVTKPITLAEPRASAIHGSGKKTAIFGNRRGDEAGR